MDDLGDIMYRHGLVRINTTQYKKDSNSHDMLGEDNQSHVKSKRHTQQIIVQACSIKIGVSCLNSCNDLNDKSIHPSHDQEINVNVCVLSVTWDDRSNDH